MPPSDPPTNAINRLRLWLNENGGLRSKLLGSLLMGALALIILAALIVAALVHGIDLSTSTLQGAARGWEIAKLATGSLLDLGALGLVIVSARRVLRLYQQYIEEIQTAEGKSRFIVDSCPDAIVILDGQGIIQSCNPATEFIFGFPIAQVVGQKITKLVPQRHFLMDLSAMGRENFMAFAERQNAVRFPVEIAVCKAEYEGQRRYVVMIHDASQRRYSDETVHHISLSVSSTTGAEYVQGLVQQLSLALESDYAFIAETNIEDDVLICTLTVAEHGQIRSKNNFRLAGTVFEEALRQNSTVFSRDVRQSFPNDTALQTLEAESIVTSVLMDNMERAVGVIGVINRSPATNIGGTRQTLQIFAARAAAEIERKQEVEGLASEKDRLLGHVSVIRDTAARERMRYEEDIAAEQELLAVTLRSIREGCITTDNEGRIVTLNPVAEQLTGCTQPEAADRPLAEVLRLTSVRGKRPLDPARLMDKAGLSSRMIVLAKDGTTRTVEVSAAPIRARKNLQLGTVLVLRDVTERQTLEEERLKAEKLESVSLAAGGIAHDFNNLLTAVIGNLSLALMDVDTRGRERIEAAKTAAFRAQDLTHQLLTFAKGGAPAKRTASLRQLVLETVNFSLTGTHIRSSIDLPEDIRNADIDVGQISQVLGNLAVNAVQAMEKGGTLYVSAENLTFTEENAPPTLLPGTYVRISLRDEGPGIPEEIQKKIFDPYFTTKPTGNGLGLATSYSIIKNHDGFLCVESVPGQGATFSFYLPASDKEVEPVAPEVNRTPEPQPVCSGQGGKVLVLDDEEVICELVSCTLTPAGYTVVQALDGQTMLRLYEEARQAGQPFDLVIMDLTIPGGMGGREAIRELKKMDPAARAIVSSGYSMDPIMTRCEEFGFCGSIAKPFDLSHLEQAVQKALATRPSA